MPPASSARPGGARPSIAASPGAWTSSPPRSARPSAAPAAASRPPGARSSTSCASAPARTSSRTRCRRRWSRASLACLELLSRTTAHRDRLAANTRWFRRAMTEAGFQIRPGEHPIVPIMLGDARLAHQMAADLLEEGIYVVGFSYPVVPEGAGAHPRPDQRRARAAPSRARGRGVRGGRPRPWRALQLGACRRTRLER